MTERGTENDTNLENAMDQVCRLFEMEWGKDNQLRIEEFISSQGILSWPFGITPDDKERFLPIMEELIHVEMDLRLSAGQTVSLDQYTARFPDFEKAVKASRERLVRTYPKLKLGSSSRTREGLSDTSVSQDGQSGDDFVVVEPEHQQLPESLGPFVEITRIASGSFGVVCKAIDTRTRKMVALKFPRQETIGDEQLYAQFLTEAKSAVSLRHDCIVKTHGVETHGNFTVIVQDFIQGSTLKPLTEKIPSQERAAEIIRQLADALAYAHQKGIYHRDLKPSNILLDEKGKPFIADFGLAIHYDQLHETLGYRAGTRAYMSPEIVQWRTHHIDGRSDIWSLGVIFYRLLTGQAPFRGKTEEVLFGEIEEKEPRSPREVNPDIDRELERICLKCLEKKVRDRYLTASDLGEDLRSWTNKPVVARTNESVRVVPKGLRSYSAEDHEFFLSLLPGPRDREGIPASIRFWTSRICEPVAEENRIPVGVIYGPSGSGKSSFVKAGLLPSLKRMTSVIFVEATSADTEVRLLKALRRAIPDIPDDASLIEVLAGIRTGRFTSGNDKVLIVLDQFEQRLSVGDDFNHSQIAKALRQCDGERLQCLVLVRDDFWLALSRFADALEMDLMEGHNSQDIDLFDKSHAKKVLMKLGQAYGRLPERSSDLCKADHAFLDEAIEQLAVKNYIICVRLTLFAEMFKERDWRLSELKSLGGVRGVGERYLETVFDPLHGKLHTFSEEMQTMLGALLPDDDCNIRGIAKSAEELKAISNLVGRPEQFNRLLQFLVHDLRLISPIDPDSSIVSNESVQGNESSFYQLTHDYLVLSVRQWLAKLRKSTWRGRIRFHFEELENSWRVRPGKKRLPSFGEFLAFLWVLPKRTRDTPSGFFSAAKKYYGLRIAIVSIVFALSLVVWLAVTNDIRVDNARSEFRMLVDGPISEVPSLIEKLAHKPNYIQSEIDKELRSDQPRNIFRTRLLLCRIHENSDDRVREFLDASIDNGFRDRPLLIRQLNRLSSKWLDVFEEKVRNNVDVDQQLEAGLILLSFGRTSLLRDLVVPKNCHLREKFIHEFQNHAWDWEQLARLLKQKKKNDESQLRGLIILAYSHSFQSAFEFDESIETLFTEISEIYQSSNSHPFEISSAEYALRRFQLLPVGENVGKELNQKRSVFPIRIADLEFKLIQIPKTKFIPNEKNVLNGVVKWTHFQPQQVELDSYWIGATPISQSMFGQFILDVRKKDPSFFPIADEKIIGDWLNCHDCPAYDIGWNAAAKFCNWLSEKYGLEPYYEEVRRKIPPELKDVITDENTMVPRSNPPCSFRLPTYAEWQTAYCYDNTCIAPFSESYETISDDVQPFGWFGQVRFLNGQKYGSFFGKLPNFRGLFDMPGNTLEWCEDSVLEFEKIKCGGSFNTPARYLLAGSYEATPKNHFFRTGVRVVISRRPVGD